MNEKGFIADKAFRVLNHIASLASKSEEKWVNINKHNYPEDSAIMSVSCEILDEKRTNNGINVKLVSIAHYGECNGDLMSDPSMTFLVNTNDLGKGFAIPVDFQNDYAGYYEKFLNYGEDLRPTVIYDTDSLVSAVEFVEMWMDSINDQQELEIA